MTLANTYYPHALVFSTGIDTVQLTDVSPSRGYQVVRENQASEAVSCFVGASESRPTMGFTSRDIKVIVAMLAGGDEGCVDDLSGDNVIALYRAGKPHGLRVDGATTTHIASILTSAAMLQLESLTARQGDFAEVTCQITAGRTAGESMTVLGSQALPAVGGCNNLYKLGKVVFNGTAIPGVTGIQLSGGVSQRTILSDGESFPSFVGVDRIEPTLSVTTADLNQFTEALATSGGDAITSVICYLQRMSETAYHYAAGSSQHIKLTIAGGIKLVDSTRSSPAETDVMFHVRKSGTEPLLKWEVDQAIT